MWKFLQSATNEFNWPKSHAKEICFIGRSNVGKSTLINALANSKIAKTSNTPGRTQLINFFYEDNMYFVDLPGYGYAKMPIKIKTKMLKMVENYLKNKIQLIKVFLLIDGKVGPTKDDELLINFLNSLNKKFIIVVTKSDKANQSEMHKTCKEVEKLCNNVLVVSSQTKKNIDKLKKIIKLTFKDK